MTKLGLFFEFIGFAMLFWQSYGRPNRKLNERALKWIPNKMLRQNLARFWQMIAFGLIIAGVIFQIIAIW